jgi:TPR repeat protein
MYELGLGVQQDYIQAHMWFNLAGAAGDAKGIKERDEIASKMTPDQIAEAQRLAREWKPKSSQ